MEHVCIKCDHTVFNNSAHPNVCPKCGGLEFISTYDEPEYKADYKYGDLEGEDDWNTVAWD